MNIYNYKSSQRGMALLAAIVIIAIFTIIGMITAQRAKESEKRSGISVRNSIVFEAAEQTLRNAGAFINNLDKKPITGFAGNNILKKAGIENFVTKKAISESLKEQIINDPGSAIVWDQDILRETICGSTKSCEAGIDFAKKIDDDMWVKFGIISDFSNIGNKKNYLNDVETYTFIQLLEPFDNSRGKSNAESFYLITVKASGYPPKIQNKSASESRENIIVQAVFAKRI